MKEKRTVKTRAAQLHERRLREVKKEFASGNMPLLLRRYLAFCGVEPISDFDSDENSESEETAEAGKRKRASVAGVRAVSHGSGKPRLPNPAGFCRFLELDRDAFGQLEAEFPVEIGRMRAVFEDEALNSELSPSVLGFYLKLLLGEQGDEEGAEGDGHLTVTFEHDILTDGK